MTRKDEIPLHTVHSNDKMSRLSAETPLHKTFCSVVHHNPTHAYALNGSGLERLPLGTMAWACGIDNVTIS